MFVPHKPLLFGNGWNIASCYETGILFFIELVEGKDSPAEYPP